MADATELSDKPFLYSLCFNYIICHEKSKYFIIINSRLHPFNPTFREEYNKQRVYCIRDGVRIGGLAGAATLDAHARAPPIGVYQKVLTANDKIAREGIFSREGGE